MWFSLAKLDWTFNSIKYSKWIKHHSLIYSWTFEKYLDRRLQLILWLPTVLCFFPRNNMWEGTCAESILAVLLLKGYVTIDWGCVSWTRSSWIVLITGDLDVLRWLQTLQPSELGGFVWSVPIGVWFHSWIYCYPSDGKDIRELVIFFPNYVNVF